MARFQCILRFEARDGRPYLAGLASPSIPHTDVRGYKSIQELEQDINAVSLKAEKILPPTPAPENEIVCIGTNYRKHAEEAKLSVPSDPVMWYKPRRALAGPGPIYVPKAAQDQFLDYEGELVIVTSKDALDVSEADAPGYILGYTVGNDLSARMFQDPRRSGGQFTRCKAFDNFAPVGPILVITEAFGSLDGRMLRTKVNGKVLQESALDLIHGPAKLVSFLSQGTTLPAGSVIMTGTPPGVGYFQEPKLCLKHGDVIEVEIDSIGTLRNEIVFD